LGFDDAYVIGWNSNNQQIRVHAPGLDTNDYPLQPAGHGHGSNGGGFRNVTVNHGIDVYAVGNLAPWPDRPPPHISFIRAWPKEAVHFEYTCDHPGRIDEVGFGHDPVLVDYYNATGGVGAYAATPPGTPAVYPSIEAGDQVRAHITQPNVTLFTAALNSVTVLQVQTPHTNRTLAYSPANPNTVDRLRDGPGDYSVTIVHADRSTLSANLVSILPTDPVPDLGVLWNLTGRQ
jgi:hypothetical protein